MIEQSPTFRKRWNIFYLPFFLSQKERILLGIFIVIASGAFLGLASRVTELFSKEIPVFGGILREGGVGNPRFINPLLAQTDIDRDLVALTFAGLLRYNEESDLTPALADRYEISEDGKTYTVFLKKNLYWSDGKPITSNDVVFTIQSAKNPQIQSPRRANWEGVEATSVDPYTVQFALQRAYIPFLDNLTLGILPKHIWENVPASQFALVDQNTKPIGAGPYRYSSLTRDAKGTILSISLEANSAYVWGTPHIKTIEFSFYPTKEAALNDLKNGFIDALGLGGFINNYLAQISGKPVVIHPFGLQRIIAVFLNQGTSKELANLSVRQALDIAIDKKELVDKTLGEYGIAMYGPLPSYATSSSQNAYNPELARKNISSQKKKLSITLTTADIPEFSQVAELIKNYWISIGIEVVIKKFLVDDLETSVIRPRRYEAFLYGEEVVGQYPDPFAFWHSSQRPDPGLNIALYANQKVDSLLEQVRTEKDPIKRESLYWEIENAIKKELPAIFLYSPSYLYLATSELQGISSQYVSTGANRFDAVHQWYLQTKPVLAFLAQ